MPVMVRRVVELSELFVTQLFVKAGRLKAERVQPCRVTAALQSARFGLSHQRTPDAAAAQSVGHPEILDEQPAALGLTREPGDNLGYAAFGQVVSGMPVVAKILSLRTNGATKYKDQRGQWLNPPVPIKGMRRV